MLNRNPNQPISGLSSSTDSAEAKSNQSKMQKMCLIPTKRPRFSPVLNGIPDSWSATHTAELLCPICFEMLSQPTVTKCGHTFCYACIHSQIETNSRCAKCSKQLTKDDLSPNFVLNNLISLKKTNTITKAIKMETEGASPMETSTSDNDNYDDMQDSFISTINKFTLTDIDVLMSELQRRKKTLAIESKQVKKSLTVDFLKELRRIRLADKETICRELELINQDVEHISSYTSVAVADDNQDVEHISSDTSVAIADEDDISANVDVEQSASTSASIASMKNRISVHFQELSQIYLDSRNAWLFDPRLNDAEVPSIEDSVLYESLDTFSETLSRMSRYHKLKPLATLSYSPESLLNSSIVSSVEFDKDSEFFAVAGVTRKIKLFEYDTVISSLVDVHCPISEIICSAKISCVAWNNYYKNKLASSDYNGCVTLWDAGTSSKTRDFNEHEKRVWSVDWSDGDPRLLASGSDDSKVRLWSTNAEKSVSVLNAETSVCCVKFCPQNTFNIAFGTADHRVHYYDFRHLSEPLGVFQRNEKPVSYVEFTSKDELISASTDSQLNLWNLKDMTAVRTFKGHTNEKHFVGLATDGNYIACGSENNSLYVYCKAFPKPMFSFKFEKQRSMLEHPQIDDSSTDFVSAVAWKKNSPVVIAANSLGSVKILELV